MVRVPFGRLSLRTGKWGTSTKGRGTKSVQHFRCYLTFLKYLCSKLQMMSLPRIPRSALPLQVAAVCYRRVNSHAEFLLVNTNGGNKWTFPKGAPEPRLSHSQVAELYATAEAGAVGI